MEFPEEWSYILEWFYQLHLGRSYSNNGPSPISYTDIINWRELFKIDISIFELQVIKKIDEIFLGEISKEQQKQLSKIKR